MGSWMYHMYLKTSCPCVISNCSHTYKHSDSWLEKASLNPEMIHRVISQLMMNTFYIWCSWQGRLSKLGCWKCLLKLGNFLKPMARIQSLELCLSRPWYLLTHTGNLKQITGPILQDKLTKAVCSYNKAESSNTLDPLVTFIKWCLQLNPVHRASAADLLEDPWLQA